MLGTRKRKDFKADENKKEDNVQTITVKNLEGNKNKNKEGPTNVDSNSLIEEINKIALQHIESQKNKYDDFNLIHKYSKGPEQNDFFTHLMTRPYDIVSALGKITDNNSLRDNLSVYIDLLFQRLIDEVAELKLTDQNFFTNFKSLLKMMLRCLEFLNPNTNSYNSYLNLMTAFGEAMSSDKNFNSILFLESVALEYILEFAKEHTNKKDALAEIIMSLCPPNPEMHLRLIKRIERMVGTNVRCLSGILAHLSIFQANHGFEGELFTIFFERALYFLYYPCPKIRTNALRIMNELSRTEYVRFARCYSHIREQCTHTWWELRAQILIVCANQLEVIETSSQDDTSK